MLDWFGGLVLSGFILLGLYEWCVRRIPPPQWYFSRRKSKAMRVALECASEAGEDVYWRGSRVALDDGEKCFVVVQASLPVGRSPEGYRMYVVWMSDGLVDDMGNWTFHWGITVSGAIEAYERCRAAGLPMPSGRSAALFLWRDSQR